MGESCYSCELVVLYACNVDVCLALYGGTDIYLAVLNVDTADTVLLVVEL